MPSPLSAENDPDTAFFPDLMDINMPGPINGLDAAEAVLKTLDVCTVMLTAYSDFQSRARAIGAYGYFLKPVTGPTLLSYLEETWEKWQHAR